jgi:Rieske [2Fe-2S] domain
MRLTRVATYERTVRASIDRVRENVLDWEHLPWLHPETFSHVRLLDRRRDGFRVESALRRALPGAVVQIDVRFEPCGLTYHSRTVQGRAAGTDIVTRLEVLDTSSTGVAVEFLVPEVAPDRAARTGASYVKLYTLLWDQDEAMMMRRQAFLDGRLPNAMREVELNGARIRHATVCPHRGGPLREAPVEEGCVRCPWHGYRFDLHTGRNADGGALRLETAPG